MRRFTKFLKNHSSGKKVFVFFILTNAVYLFMLMVTIPRTMGFSKGMKLLDMMPTGYDYNYVSKLFNTLGEMGRATYLHYQIPVDMIYPLLFGLTYCLMLSYFLKKLNKLNAPFTYLCLLPVIAGIADYLENIGIILMLKSYPELNENMVHVTNIFTVIKSIATSLFFMALLVFLIMLGFKSLTRKRSDNNALK